MLDYILGMGVQPQGAFSIFYNGVQLDYGFPLGFTGTYIPKLSDAIVVPTGALLTRFNDPSIYTTGNIYATTLSAGLNWFEISGLPAKTTSVRKYEMWGYSDDPFSGEKGIRLLFNHTDSNNYWEWTVYAYGGTGALRGYFGQVSGGGFNFRGSTANMAALQAPIHWNTSVYDLGDTVSGALMGWEADTTNEVGAQMTTYTPGTTRADKNSTTIRIANAGGGGGFIRLRGIRISDI